MVKTGATVSQPDLSWPQSAAGFDALIEATQHRLIQFAYCRVQSLADAEDIVQDVFVRAYRERARYRHVDNVVPFLFRMVANRSTDLLRARKRIVDSPPGEAPVFASADERHSAIERLLDRLPARQAAVIRLRIYGDLPFDAVARSVGCSVPTVKSRFRYGIQKLRRLLERKGGVL
jgi:RNA polymerase sigma-70 factor (ECF subfamily)